MTEKPSPETNSEVHASHPSSGAENTSAPRPADSASSGSAAPSPPSPSPASSSPARTAGSASAPKPAPADQAPGPAHVPATPHEAHSPHAEKSSFRELLDTIVFVIFLVLLLKTFIAEAFVIPTGSMAPTRLGNHFVNTCPQCGHEYYVGYSSDSFRRRAEPPEYVVCPNCRHAHSPAWIEGGDKVLVLKTIYDFRKPDPAQHRHDTIVFKFPGWGERAIGDQEFEGPTSPHYMQAFSPYNYIKRLWGFPGERLAIWLGDVYLATDEEKPKLTILRKRPDRLLDMRQLVYDADHEPRALAEALSRWEDEAVRPVPGAERPGQRRAADHWQRQLQPADSGFAAEFHVQAGDTPRCLRYEHRVPKEWNLAAEGGAADGERGRRRVFLEATAEQIRKEPPLPQLITDFTAYNWTNLSRYSWHWVRDLMLDCELEVLRAEGTLALELIAGVDRYRAEFELSTGQCRLHAWREGLPLQLPDSRTRPTVVTRPGRYHLQFADFDQRLTVWVNGKLVFGDGVEVPPLRADQQGPRLADLAPAGIWAHRTEVKVRHLQLWRDIYYTQRDPEDVRLILVGSGGQVIEASDVVSLKNVPLEKYRQWAENVFRKLAEEKPLDYRDALSAEQAALHRIRPERWAPYYPRGIVTHQITPAGTVAFGTEGSYAEPAFYPDRPHGGPRVFGPDEYFVLGDNSTSSQDSRAWGQVPERLLMGKAVVVYFPFRPFGSPRLGLIR
ncbi:MAG: S26 family signal peptidase [Gemmatales bacterium]|nr:S26 family signal peptidase [Gemmatales bacterium]MDW8175201.1 S26 family signal peptidase [Gemmatales bacterium]